jgi:hypothetical protein
MAAADELRKTHEADANSAADNAARPHLEQADAAAGELWKATAERLYLLTPHKMKLREIAPKVGMSLTGVSLFLKWRRSNFEAKSPYGETKLSARLAAQEARRRAKAAAASDPAVQHAKQTQDALAEALADKLDGLCEADDFAKALNKIDWLGKFGLETKSRLHKALMDASYRIDLYSLVLEDSTASSLVYLEHVVSALIAKPPKLDNPEPELRPRLAAIRAFLREVAARNPQPE